MKPPKIIFNSMEPSNVVCFINYHDKFFLKALDELFAILEHEYISEIEIQRDGISVIIEKKKDKT